MVAKWKKKKRATSAAERDPDTGLSTKDILSK